MKLVIFAAFLLFMSEGITLIKKRMWNELTAVVLLLLTAVILQIGRELNMESIIDLLEKIFEPVGKMIFYQY